MLRLRTLGGLDLRSDNGQDYLSVLTQPKRMALFCYLCIARPRGPHRRDTLVGLFWPEHDAAHARHALRQSIYFLRQTLGAAVLRTYGQEEVAVDPAAVWCDVVAFESAVDGGRPEAALALYAGDLLPGVFADGADGFEQWLEAERSRLRGRAADAAWRVTEQKERAGDGPGAVAWARRAAGLLPDDEVSLRGLMALLERQGDRAGALRAYHAFAWRLEQEYELEPSPETVALAEALRQRAEATPPPPDSRPEPSAAAPAPSPAPAQATCPEQPARRSVLRWAAPALLVGATALSLAAVAYRFSHRSDGNAETAGPGLAVLPAEVHGVDPYLREGLADLLASSLDGAGGIRAISSRTVLTRWRQRFGSGVEPNLGAALGLAHGVGARWAVFPVATRLGHRVRLTARIYDVGGARQLGSTQAEAPLDSLSMLVERASIQVAETLAGRKDARSALPVGTRVGTSSLPALKVYLQARALERQAAFRGAAALFDQAIALDSSFALAWRGLWNAALWAPEYLERSPAILARTVAALERQPARDRLYARLILAVTSGDPGMVGFARQAVRRYPDDPEIALQVAELIWHHGSGAGAGVEEAVDALDHAIELDSLFAIPYIHRIEYAIRTADTLALARLLPAAARAFPAAEHGAEPSMLEFRIFELLYAALRDSVEGARRFRVFADTAHFAAISAASEAMGWGGIGRPAFTPPVILRLRADFDRRVWHRIRAGLGWLTPQEAPVAAAFSMRLGMVSVTTGQIAQALSVAATGSYPFLPLLHYRIQRTGYPLPRAFLDSALAVSTSDTTLQARGRNLAAGAYAAELGRWHDHDAAVRNAALLRQRLAPAGGPQALVAESYARALGAYGDARRGRTDQATDVLEHVLARPGTEFRLRNIINWWLGELHEDRQHYDEALRHYQILGGDPLAQSALGRCHERLGDTEAARTAYERAVAGWENADPGYPPLARARRALGGLASAPR